MTGQTRKQADFTKSEQRRRLRQGTQIDTALRSVLEKRTPEVGSDPEERGVECEGGRTSSGDSQVSGDHGGPRRNVLQSGQGYGEFVHEGKGWGAGCQSRGWGLLGQQRGSPEQLRVPGGGHKMRGTASFSEGKAF